MAAEISEAKINAIKITTITVYATYHQPDFPKSCKRRIAIVILAGKISKLNNELIISSAEANFEKPNPYRLK